MEQLVLKAQRGDRLAFAEIVRNRHRLVLILAANYLGWEDAEDAAQHIWLAVWRKLWQVEKADRFDSWLQKLVFYQCLNIRKARARRRELEIPLSPETWSSLGEYVATDDSQMDEILVHRELRRLVSRELDKLPGEYGLLLRLYYLKDLSYKEIAEITGLPQSTLKWRLHQGRKLLKASLAHHLANLDLLRRFSHD
jgi:RNA polymerase sigma-70 factor (ECF subfamily)